MPGPRNCTSVHYVFVQDHLCSPSYSVSAADLAESDRQAYCLVCGPACGHRSGLSGFSAVRFCTTSHEVSPLLIAVRWLWEKPHPFGEFELPTCVESIIFCVCPSPSGFVSYSTECAELYTAGKCSFGDIEQGGWGV